jgi:hypothetical protein
MTLSKQTVVLGIDDAKIFQLTADTASALTYGSPIDVPGIQKIDLTPKFTEKGLKGDEKILDYYVNLDLIAWEIHSAKVSLDVLEILEGGTTVTTGTTPNQVHTYTVKDTSNPKYFKIEAKASYTAGEAGDFHMRLFKCKATSVDIDYTTQDYAIVSASGIAIPTTNNGNIKEYVINETATAIS